MSSFRNVTTATDVFVGSQNTPENFYETPQLKTSGCFGVNLLLTQLGSMQKNNGWELHLCACARARVPNAVIKLPKGSAPLISTKSYHNHDELTIYVEWEAAPSFWHSRGNKPLRWRRTGRKEGAVGNTKSK